MLPLALLAGEISLVRCDVQKFPSTFLCWFVLKGPALICEIKPTVLQNVPGMSGYTVFYQSSGTFKCLLFKIENIVLFWDLLHIYIRLQLHAVKDVESDMHSWSEATAGLHKHAPCGRNDVPARGHCLPRIPLFGQDSKNHIDFSSPQHFTSAPARQRFSAHLLGINLQCGYSQLPRYVNI